VNPAKETEVQNMSSKLLCAAGSTLNTVALPFTLKKCLNAKEEL
jgi:hypothetical protein